MKVEYFVQIRCIFLFMCLENQNVIDPHDIPFLYFCICFEFGPKWFIIAKRKLVFYNLDINVLQFHRTWLKLL